MNYLKAHYKTIIAILIIYIIFLISFYLYSLPLEAVIYPILLSLFLIIVLGLLDYTAFMQKHHELKNGHLVKPVTLIDRDYQNIIKLLEEEKQQNLLYEQSRYQEMIDAHIAPEMQKTMQAVAAAGGDMTKVNGDSIYPVLNMLNTKYFIMPLQGGQTVPVQNPYAYGNAWFVDEVKYVNNANEEIDGVGKVNLRHVAVADAKFKEQLAQSVKQDDTSVVKMTQYKPNNLTYEVKSSKGGVIVFSEIYYPGWTATVDGQPAELGRVNYILRALNVKAGSHKVVLDFHPQSLKNTETVAYIGYGVLALLIIIGVVVEVRKRKKE